MLEFKVGLFQMPKNNINKPIMNKVVIPSNTHNYISKVSEHHNNISTTALFLGSLEATNPVLLQEYHIKAILTMGWGLEVKAPPGVAHKVIHIEDHPSQNIAQYFSECNEFIKQQLSKGNVLVHCRAGVSRSASVVLAYTMKTKKIRLLHAFEKVREVRNFIKPNASFMTQLKEYERKLKKALEVKGLQLK